MFKPVSAHIKERQEMHTGQVISPLPAILLKYCAGSWTFTVALSPPNFSYSGYMHLPHTLTAQKCLDSVPYQVHPGLSGWSCSSLPAPPHYMKLYWVSFLELLDQCGKPRAFRMDLVQYPLVLQPNWESADDHPLSAWFCLRFYHH